MRTVQQSLRLQKKLISKAREIIEKRKPVETSQKWSDFTEFVSQIDGKDGRKIKPYPFQLEVRKLLKGVVWVGKIRQLGFTQLLLWEAIYRAVSSPFFCAVIFCRSGEDVSLITRRARLIINSVGVKTTTDSLSIIELNNGSKIIFKNSSQLGTRSIDSVDFLLFDEAAFVRHIDIIYRASLPSTSSAINPTIIVVSTPKHGSWFNASVLADNPGYIDVLEVSKKLVTGEVKGGLYHWKDNNNATKILLSHRCHPTYSKIDDYVSYRAKIEGISTDQSKQEYGLGWQSGETQTVFSVDLIKQCAVLDELEIYPPGDDFDDMANAYVCGLDSAGFGDDYVVLTIWYWNENEDIMKLAYLYRKRKQTAESHLFNLNQILEKTQSIVAVETNGIGQFYYEKLNSSLFKNTIIPIKTTQQSKLLMLQELQLRLETQRIVFPEKSPITSELLNFQRIGEKFSAPSGQNDDCVMSACFACQVISYLKEKEQKS